MIPPKELTRVAGYLEENGRFGTLINHSPIRRQFATLRNNAMFEALKNLYKELFLSHWDKFKRLVKIHIPAPSDTQKSADYAAAVYVSAWFHDLYVANRNAGRKLCCDAFDEMYYYDAVSKLTEHDAFLAHLNGCIRPTHVKCTHEDSLLIPCLSFDLQPDDPRGNFLGITGYEVNDSLLYGLVHIMKVQKVVKLVPLPDNTIGRPVWLFDWHEDGQCYAWFPAQTNYNASDVAVAYILGVACTAQLGPPDRDEWQDIPGNIIPQDLRELDHAGRVCAFINRCPVMHRVIETRAYRLPDSVMEHAKIPQEAGNEVVMPALNQFRIIDYMYHARVVEYNDMHSRIAAFRMFINP